MSFSSQSSERHSPDTAGEGRYWVALFGGALTWLAHLLSSYILAEFGCESVLANYSYLGINAVAWGLLVLTLLTAAAAGGCVLLALRVRPPNDGDKGGATDLVARTYAARAGLIADVAFALVILVESAPLFYYLQHCH